MGINFQTQKLAGHFPELWRGESKVLPGGFKPANTLVPGMVIRPGTPLYVDFDTRSAAVCKTAKVVNGGTTTAPRVSKGHYFAVGDSVAVNDGTVKQTVKSIDTTNADYDVITFNAALTGVKADDVLIETDAAALAEGAKAAPRFAPNMIVPLIKEIKSTGINTLDAAYDAIVLIPSLAATPMISSWLNGCFLAANPNILYIKQ